MGHDDDPAGRQPAFCVQSSRSPPDHHHTCYIRVLGLFAAQACDRSVQLAVGSAARPNRTPPSFWSTESPEGLLVPVWWFTGHISYPSYRDKPYKCP